MIKKVTGATVEYSSAVSKTWSYEEIREKKSDKNPLAVGVAEGSWSEAYMQGAASPPLFLTLGKTRKSHRVTTRLRSLTFHFLLLEADHTERTLSTLTLTWQLVTLRGTL